MLISMHVSNRFVIVCSNIIQLIFIFVIFIAVLIFTNGPSFYFIKIYNHPKPAPAYLILHNVPHVYSAI